MVQYNPFTDEAVLTEFGKRVASFRLNNNWTQADLANKAGVSKSTVEHLEKGQSTQLLNLVKILRALDLLQQFVNLVPEQGPSPMELLMQSRNLQKIKRKRASKARGDSSGTLQNAKNAATSSATNATATANIAAESKAGWVWDEDK